MNYFNAADWLVIILYLVGIIALGLWFGKDQKNTKDYFLGSRNIPWWGVGLAIVATETSALTFIGVPAMAYGADALTFIQIVIGYVIARIILAIVMVPHYFKGEIYSPYQLFSKCLRAGGAANGGWIFSHCGNFGRGRPRLRDLHSAATDVQYSRQPNHCCHLFLRRFVADLHLRRRRQSSDLGRCRAISAVSRAAEFSRCFIFRH